MENMKKPLGTGMTILLLVMILALIFVGYFFIILQPLLTQTSDVQSQTTQEQATLEGLRAQQEKYVQMKQTLQEEADTNVVIPAFDNEAPLLDAMNALMNGASTYNISASLPSSSDDTTDKSVVRRVFQIRFTCPNLSQAQNLIDGLRKIPYRNQISALSLTNGVDSADTISNLWTSSIDTQLIITFYETQ